MVQCRRVTSIPWLVVLVCAATLVQHLPAIAAETVFTPDGKPPEDPKPLVHYDADKNTTEITGQSIRFRTAASDKATADKAAGDGKTADGVNYVTFHFHYSYEGKTPQASQAIWFQFKEVTTGPLFDTDDIIFRFSGRTKAAAIRTALTPGEKSSTVLFDGKVALTIFRDMAQAKELSFRFADRDRLFTITEPFMPAVRELLKSLPEEK